MGRVDLPVDVESEGGSSHQRIGAVVVVAARQCEARACDRIALSERAEPVQQPAEIADEAKCAHYVAVCERPGACQAEVRGVGPVAID